MYLQKKIAESMQAADAAASISAGDGTSAARDVESSSAGRQEESNPAAGTLCTRQRQFHASEHSLPIAASGAHTKDLIPV